MTTANNLPQNAGSFHSHLCKFALDALEVVPDSSVSLTVRMEHVERANQAVRTAILIRKSLDGCTNDRGELAVFDKASGMAAKYLKLEKWVVFSKLEESLRVVGALRNIMIAVIEGTDPCSHEAAEMQNVAARIANMAMRVSTRATTETSDHVPEMPRRAEADVGISALLIADSLSATVEEAWRLSSTRAATKKAS